MFSVPQMKTSTAAEKVSAGFRSPNTIFQETTSFYLLSRQSTFKKTRYI
jgi:hypothetical protein